MRHLRFLLLLLVATPAAAAWETRQSEGFASTSYQGDRYRAEISCNRGRGLELRLFDESHRGDAFDGVRGLMVWVTLPDGRTDRWPVDVVQEGPALAGELIVSDFNLDFFRSGERFVIDSPLTRTVFLEGDMRGTGAARLAFIERCGV
jgi:hypothetical protein